MSSLFVIQGQDQGKRFDLDRICTTIGRDTVNHVRLNDSEASRQHAEIRQDDLGEAFYLTDLGSSNGSYINGKLIERQILKSGDRLQFGSTLMIYTGPDVGDNAVAFSEDIDIVPEQQESQIISSLPHDENSQFFYGDAADHDSPWLARARSNLQVMYRTALAVSHTLDIDELLERIMGLIFEWVEADRGCILLKDRTTDELIPRARQNRPGVESDGKLTISQTILDYVLTNSEGVLTSDARDDERFDDAGSIVKAGVREAIGVPMQGRYGVVGIIYIDTYTPPGDWAEGSSKKFSEEHLKMMIAIAHQAALAVEDTAYYSAMLQSERLAAIGQTITGLSHHVKNILQGIRGGSYLIEEGLKSTETDLVRTGWGIVEKNQEKISRLVLDMLTFSKEREPDVSDANLNTTISDVVELMEARANLCGVALEFEPDESIPTLRFDSEGVHHALLNVVTNAIDACEAAWQNRIVDFVGPADRGAAIDSAVESEEKDENDAAEGEKIKVNEAGEGNEAEEASEEERLAILAQEIERTAEESSESLQSFAKVAGKDDDPADWAGEVAGEESDWTKSVDGVSKDGEQNSEDFAESDDEESSADADVDRLISELAGDKEDGGEENESQNDGEAENDGETESSDKESSEENDSDEHENDDEHADDQAESGDEEHDESESKELAAEVDSDSDADDSDGESDSDSSESEEQADDADSSLVGEDGESEEELEFSEDELIILDDEELEPGSRGTVFISTQYFEQDRRIEVHVKDNGEGIDDENLRRIFTVFNSTKGNQGTGLGLSVSQKILHEHGGDIRVTSRRGYGSTFTLVMPAIFASEHAEPESADPADEDGAGNAEVTDHGVSQDGTTAADVS